MTELIRLVEAKPITRLVLPMPKKMFSRIDGPRHERGRVSILPFEHAMTRGVLQIPRSSNGGIDRTRSRSSSMRQSRCSSSARVCEVQMFRFHVQGTPAPLMMSENNGALVKDLTGASRLGTMTDMSVTSSVRERLLTAAVEVFASKGYTATRVSDIVREAGVAQGTFYLYFKSKQAIFEQLIDTCFERLLAETLGTYSLREVSRPEEVIEQTHVLWFTVLQQCRQARALVTLSLREAFAAGPEVVSRLQANYQQVIDGVAAYIEIAIERGLYRRVDPHLAGWALVGMLERAIHYAVFVNEQADLDQLATDLVRLQLGGLLTDEWEDHLASRQEHH
jgi:AcrR family transcriptional regulator